MSGECTLGKPDPRHLDDILRQQLRSFYVWPEWAEGPELHCPDRGPRKIKLLEAGSQWAAKALQEQMAVRAAEDEAAAQRKRRENLKRPARYSGYEVLNVVADEVISVPEFEWNHKYGGTYDGDAGKWIDGPFEDDGE